MQPNVFDFFRKQNQSTRDQIVTVEKVFFKIDFDGFGAFLTVVDEKGKEVEVSYLHYGGVDRQILKLIDQIQERNSFLIDWEKPDDFLYLADQEHLMDLLKRTKSLVNSQRQPIRFLNEQGEIILHLLEKNTEDKTIFDSKVKLYHDEQEYENFQIVTESFALVDAEMVEMPSLGVNFSTINYFNTLVSEEELPVFLSLFFSNMENVKNVRLRNYKFIFTDEHVTAEPSIIFEKIDSDESLIMRVAQSLPELGVEALDQFELFKLAEINDLEGVVTVKYIDREPIESIVQEVEKLLKKQTPSKRQKGGKKMEVVVEGELFIVPKEIAANFIYNELPDLLVRYKIFGAEKLKSYKISTVSPSLSMNLSHNIDFFEGDVTLDFGGEQMNLFDVIKQFNKNRYVQLSDGTHALMNENYIKKLERIFKKKDDQVQVSFFDMPLVEEIIEEKISSDVFRKPREFYAGLNEIEEVEIESPEVKATLRPYQEQGYNWLRYLYDYQLGGCLADDMGLGKTLQTIALLAFAHQTTDKSSLIVMPRSLLFNWQREVKKFAPQLSTYIFHGNDRDFGAALKTDLILTTYAIVRNEIERLKEESFLYVVLDESQNIKNVNALTTKAIMLLQADYRLALSGTPVENNLGELYSLFRFLNPAMFGTLTNFNRDYLTPIQKHGDKVAMRHLRQKIYPFVLRRLKQDVLKDLPDKIEQTLYVEMSDAQRNLYEQRRQFYQAAIKAQIAKKGIKGSQFFIFQAMNELRQIASIPENISDGKVVSPKREMLEEQLLDLIANGHKALVFANYLAAVELIGEAMEKAGIDYVSMTGATRDRQRLVDRFQNNPDCKVFIMTLKTGGTGLNLTSADTIFIFDPWWNVAAENQAIDRAHRFGQTNKVLAYKLITQGTIEEKILELQQLKKELFDSIITTDGAATKSLSEDDIDFILGGV